MSVLIIRKHKRFAVRHQVRLICAGARPHSALLVEVSLEGGRLSLSGSSAFVVEQPVMVRIGGFGNVQARVRWAGEGFVGLRFDAPLHNAELDLLLQACRPEFAQDSTMRAYGK